MDQNTKQTIDFSNSLNTSQEPSYGVGFKNTYKFEAFDKEGNLKWEETVNNLVVNTGLDHILNNYYKASNFTAAHFVGLLSNTPTIAAADTMGTHAGWSEITAFSEAARQALTLGTVSGQSVNNSASKAVFTINGTANIGGAFISTSATFGDNGVLIGAAAFTTGNRSLISGDTLNVTVTLSATSS